MIDYVLGEDGIAIITIDRPDSPLNIFSLEAFERLDAIVDEILAIEGGPPLGLIFISGKRDNFVVGVDLKILHNMETVAEASAASRRVQTIFRRFANLPIPTVAAINGNCMGGGLELALNCSARIITDDASSSLSLPEVLVGILPGASGSQLLPRLIGLRSALSLMLTGRRVFPRKALKLGLVDQVVSKEALLTAARRTITSYKKPKRDRLMQVKSIWGKLSRSPIVAIAKFKLKRSGATNFPAPFVILGLMNKSYGEKWQHGLALEAEMFARLNQTAASRALMHIFFASGDKGVEDGGEAIAVQQIGIVGAGLMGAGIAALALDNSITVRLNDVSHQALGSGYAKVRHYFKGQLDKGILKRGESVAKLANCSLTTTYAGMGRSQIAIEAVFEDLALKQKIVTELETEMADDAIIATNSSALSIADIGAEAKHPQRVIGMHFFSPVEKMQLLEIIPSPQTDAKTLATAISMGRRLGKKVIVVTDSPGFFVNRILTPYLNEAFKLLRAGMPVDKLDAAARSFGFPVGPCELMDAVGFDVIAKVVERLNPFMGERIQMIDVAAKFVSAKRLGKKNGRGFYKYRRGGKAAVDKQVYKLITKKKGQKFDLEIVRRRLLYSILNEAAHALEDGVIGDPAVGDIGAVFGFGYPAHTGGPYWHIDQIGAANLIEQLTKLESKYGSRFEPAPGLIGMASAGISYYG